MKKAILLLLTLSSTIFSYSLEKDTLDWLNYSEVHTIESDNGKLRLLTFRAPNKGKLQYIHELRYKVAPNETRSSSLQDPRFFNFSAYNSLIINKIHHVEGDTYLLEGINEGNEYILAGIDIGRGIAKNAYFVTPTDGEHKSLISFSFDTLNHPTKEMKAEFAGDRLRLPNYGQDERAEGKEYVDYYFNGTHYEDSLSHVNTVRETQNGEEIITRIIFKDEENRFAIDALYPKMLYSVVVTIVSEGGNYKRPTSLRLESTEKEEHFQGKKFNVSMSLQMINGRVFVEGLDSYHFPIIKAPRWWQKRKLKNVKYTAGRKSAFPYEWLRYSAVMFNCPIKDKEHSLVHWALEVDGELQLLEGEEWHGTQIDLQMKEEWLGKTIKVTPYIQGREMDERMTIETKVVPYKVVRDFLYYNIYEDEVENEELENLSL